jgi:hypothetical protein
MEEEFGVPIDPIRLFENPSVDAFVQALAGGVAGPEASQTLG